MTSEPGKRTMPRRLLVTAAALVMLAAAVGTLLVSKQVASAPLVTNADWWTPKIHACAGTSDLAGLAKAGHDAAFQDCMVDLMVTAAKNNQVPAISAAIRKIVDANLAFYGPCHDIMHAAGSKAFSLYDSMADMVYSNRADVCGYGFVHGGLDAFAFSKPTKDEFVAAYKACKDVKESPGMQRAEGLCAHGLGHVAWLGTLNIPEAADWCSNLTGDAMKSACGDGVIMEIYQPVTGEAFRPLEDSQTELFDICAREWPNPETAGYGCYSGAGYIYLRDAHAYVSTHIAPRGDYQADKGTLTDTDRTELKRIVERAVELCHRHENAKGVAACLEMTASEVPVPVRWDPQLLELLCRQMDDSYERCMTYEQFF